MWPRVAAILVAILGSEEKQAKITSSHKVLAEKMIVNIASFSIITGLAIGLNVVWYDLHFTPKHIQCKHFSTQTSIKPTT